MYCICCEKNKIKPSGLFKGKINEESHIWDKVERERGDGEKWTETTNNRMWDGGIVYIIDAGYGSSHDTDRFVIAICDDCVSKKKESGTLLYYGNYMSPNYKFVGEEINKSKKLYKRRRDLDELTEED